MIDLVFKNYTSQIAPGKSFFKKVINTPAKKNEKLRNIETNKMMIIVVFRNCIY